MNPFQSLREYERFVYTLPQQNPRLVRSTLIVARRGRRYAELTGELVFPGGYRLVAYERLAWDTGPLAIIGYSYEVWRPSLTDPTDTLAKSAETTGSYEITPKEPCA